MHRINPRVVDLSHYDDVQDKFAGAVKFGIRGVINKITEGVGHLDESWAWRKDELKELKLLRGVYHFMRPGRPDEQAKYFLLKLGDDAHDASLRMVLDWEVEGCTVDEAKTWLTAVHEMTGRWPWLYTYSSFLSELFTTSVMADPFWKTNIKLWIAAYNDHPWWPHIWDKPVLWQYTGDGRGLGPHNVPGIVIHGGNGIDISSFWGTDEELEKAWLA